jgi:hypothetical protein
MTADKTLLKRNKILFVVFYPLLLIAACNIGYYIAMVLIWVMQKVGVLDAFFSFMDFMLLK